MAGLVEKITSSRQVVADVRGEVLSGQISSGLV